jgi:transcriptional regulator with GAF, ATPase, and Fis domain
VDRLHSEDLPILILGETGSGKGVLARWLHDRSRRAREAMVDLNCAGLTREFLATELFGHERGAFTGATQAKEDLVEIADQGTLFLDEVGDVDLQIQRERREDIPPLATGPPRSIGRSGSRTSGWSRLPPSYHVSRCI